MADHAASESFETGLRRIFARPRLMGALCVVVLAGTGWIALGLMLAGELRHGIALGPDPLGRALLDALCRPGFASAYAPAHATGTALDLLLIWLMWSAMALAMMLPTAGPMIMTYADIAAAARHKGEPVVSPAVLTAGYLSVWLGFAVVATGLQWALTRLAVHDPSIATAGGLFSGAVFLAAGAYQFSALKHACVTLCQRPFPFFFANWTAQASGVFRLGLRQGAYCVGCCWAMMLVMLAFGVMNVVWMAALGVIMTIEKISTTTRFSRAIGAAFAAIGVAFLVSAIAAHWPVHGA